MRQLLALVGWLVVAAIGCSTTVVAEGTPIDCDTEVPGRLILFAQAVPTASVVPCLGELPPGWLLNSIETRTGEALVVFENDTHDVNVAASLRARCDLAGLREPSEEEVVSVNETVDGAVALVFEGGCFQIGFPGVVSEIEAAALLDAISHLSRDELRALTGWTL